MGHDGWGVDVRQATRGLGTVRNILAITMEEDQGGVNRQTTDMVRIQE